MKTTLGTPNENQAPASWILLTYALIFLAVTFVVKFS